MLNWSLVLTKNIFSIKISALYPISIFNECWSGIKFEIKIIKHGDVTLFDVVIPVTFLLVLYLGKATFCCHCTFLYRSQFLQNKVTCKNGLPFSLISVVGCWQCANIFGYAHIKKNCVYIYLLYLGH